MRAVLAEDETAICALQILRLRSSRSPFLSVRTKGTRAAPQAPYALPVTLTCWNVSALPQEPSDLRE
jgi:hypothetical protein